jgi:hypothetical protein
MQISPPGSPDPWLYVRSPGVLDPAVAHRGIRAYEEDGGEWSRRAAAMPQGGLDASQQVTFLLCKLGVRENPGSVQFRELPDLLRDGNLLAGPIR